MEAQLRAEREASDRHNWLPRAIQSCGTPAPGVSLFVCINKLLTNMTEIQKPKEEVTFVSVIGTILMFLTAPFMLLLVLGFPILALGSLYFFLTLGDFNFLIGTLVFGGIAYAMWRG